MAAGIFLAAGGLLNQMMLGALYARQNQQAIDLASEAIEEIRGAGYAAAAMTDTDVAGDQAIAVVGGERFFDPDGTGAVPAEKVVVARGGVVSPHVRTVVKNKTAYTISRYVTTPADATGASYKRVTVRVRWTRGAAAHTRQAGTLITLTRRGLPLPDFTFGTPLNVTVNQGATAVLPVTLVNRGARDSWNLSTTVTRTGWSFLWYVDTNKDGVRQPTETTLLGDADGDGRRDTGAVEPDQTVWLFAVATVPVNEASGVVKVTPTAQSMGQPSSPSGTAYFTDVLTVVNESCAGCTYRSYYFQNSVTGGDTVAQADMPMSETVPTAATLANYDTDYDAYAGRVVARGGSGADELVLAKAAGWRYQLPGRTTFRGNALVDLRAAMRGFTPTTSATLRVFLRAQLTGTAYTTVATASVALPASASGTFQSVQASLPVDFELPRNRRLEVKVEVDATSQDDVWLAYGTSAYPARVRMPVV